MSDLDLSVVMAARLELEASRIDAVDLMRTVGAESATVDQLTGGRLGSIVANQRHRLASRDPEHLDFAALAKLSLSIDNLAREGVSLAMGALAREAGLDDGACAQTDGFVRWLAGKGDLTAARRSVPGNAHAVHRSTDVIRRQLPDYGLWSLPILAHEFGHLATVDIRAWDAEYDTMLSSVADQLAALDNTDRSRQTELFCDLFASYVLGPSFLCTLVFHECNPAAPAATVSASHPSDAIRVLAADQLLSQVRGSVESHAFDTQLYWARRAWAQMQAQTPGDAVVSEQQTGETLRWVFRWWAVLSSQMSGFAYAWSPVIESLEDYLRGTGQPPPAGGYSPADVLNAAWTVRLRSWFEDRSPAGDYEARARELLDLSLASEAP